MAATVALPLDGSVVKMKGLPFKATADDVLKFFQTFTLKPDSIFLKRHPDGRPNGEAFIVFDNPDEARRATQKDRETFGDKFGDRYVRVYPTLESDVSDMQAAVVQQNMALQQGVHPHIHLDSVVKMKSLPFDATQLDIIQFFEGLKLKPNGVQLVVRSDNKPTGEAFVDFENHEEAARAVREKDHKVFHEKFGDRYVRLIQVSRKEMQATLALRFGGEGILKVKGIPFKATAQDVRKFFTGYKIKPDGVSFIMHTDGRPTGMAFIEFDTPQEAVRAMEKDRAKFGPEYGDRFCMLQLVGRHEMDKVTLQKETDANSKLLNGLNVLQAAALATQAALNPALQPMLFAQNPWLSAALPLGLSLPQTQVSQNPLASQLGSMPPTTGSLPQPLLDAAASQLGGLSAQFNALGGPPKSPDEPMYTAFSNGGLSAANHMTDLGLLHHQQALPNSPPQTSTPGLSSWLAGMDTPLAYYNQTSPEKQWGDARWDLGALHAGQTIPTSLASLAPSPLQRGSLDLQYIKTSGNMTPHTAGSLSGALGSASPLELTRSLTNGAVSPFADHPSAYHVEMGPAMSLASSADSQVDGPLSYGSLGNDGFVGCTSRMLGRLSLDGRPLAYP